MAYRGRFAPTPSGPLHFGSLVAAMGSYLDARANQGEWLLRIEDVDPPRIAPGAEAAILRTLEKYGFEWNGAVCRQSQRRKAYQAALDRLIESGLVYGCNCTRKSLLADARMGVDGRVYPGHCRSKPVQPGQATRLRVPDQRMVFEDALLGRVACEVAHECGDFALQRADGVFTYQLAVVVDDAEYGITHVVRGADLLASTPRQRVLQEALGYAHPCYLHLPVVLDEAGQKLSKQTLAVPLDDSSPLPALQWAAHFLGMKLAEVASVAGFWQQAVQSWQLKNLPAVRGMKLNFEAGVKDFAVPNRRSCS